MKNPTHNGGNAILQQCVTYSAIPWEVNSIVIIMTQNNNVIQMTQNNNVIKLDALVFGCLLGDAYLNRYGVITIEHSLKQNEYVVWKFQLFKQFNVLTEKSIPKLVNRIHPKTKKRTQSLRFNTKSMFKTQRLWFYPSMLTTQLEALTVIMEKK
jgi:hypothetical protein